MVATVKDLVGINASVYRRGRQGKVHQQEDRNDVNFNAVPAGKLHRDIQIG